MICFSAHWLWAVPVGVLALIGAFWVWCCIDMAIDRWLGEREARRA